MYADVRQLSAARLLADLGRWPDWIVGSPPCQDASVAHSGGDGAGGDRTGLFFEAVRLVDEIRPAWACFENVPGLRTRGGDRVLAALEAIGYTCWPLVVGAWHAGAPHRRNRVWIVAADLSGDGCGQGRTRRPDPGFAGEREQTLQDAADADALRKLEPSGIKRDQRRRAGNGRQQDAADAAGGTGPAGASGIITSAATRPTGGGFVEPDPGHASLIRRHDERLEGPCRDQQPEGAARRSNRAAATGDPDGARLAFGEGIGSNAQLELAPLIRAIAEGSGWNGEADGLARSLRMADGIHPRMARACISAYGDAVMPQITEAIARAMLSVEPRPG
jgi:DNA (cytosine-5)-methyltransferase 1